jgi:hypothetical protein
MTRTYHLPPMERTLEGPTVSGAEQEVHVETEAHVASPKG